MARTVEDVLARRTRALFLNAGAAEAMAPDVVRLMGGWDGSRRADQVTLFAALLKGYEICRPFPCAKGADTSFQGATRPTAVSPLRAVRQMPRERVIGHAALSSS